MKDSHRLQGKIVLHITNTGFQHIPRIFFLFCDLDIIDFFEVFGGIHEYFGTKNLIPWVVIMKSIKKKLIPPWRPAGPSDLRSGLRSALHVPLRPSGSAGLQRVINLFFHRVS